MDYIIGCDLALGNLGMVVVTEGDFSITPEARRSIAQRANFNGRPLMPMAVIGTGPVVRAIFVLLINAIRITLLLSLIHICTLVIATNDDLANVEIALDARRLNPHIRVVLRMFDENIANKLRDAFHLDCLLYTSRCV